MEAVNIQCPYCGETKEIVVVPSDAEHPYMDDCQVCCRPITITVVIDEEGAPRVEVSQEDDT